MIEILYFLAPFFPAFIRSVFSIQLKKHLKEVLAEEENDRENIRSYVLGLGGFSFSALIALILVQPSIQINLQYPIYYIFLSFLCYLFTLNLQGYKSNRFHDILSDTLIETASLCLILTIISLLFSSDINDLFVYPISIFALVIWCGDFLIRLDIVFNFLSKKGE